MPELAEVEFFRKQWDVGLGLEVRSVSLNRKTRLFRRCNVRALEEQLPGAFLIASETYGKRLLFRLRGKGGGAVLWLGLHLGMSGKLSARPAPHRPEKHEHLVLSQRETALVFTDPRQFGRVEFAVGDKAPAWWRDLPPGILSAGFTGIRLKAFLERHSRRSIKAVLLMQEGFPGLGNWMVDEILWQAEIHPARSGGSLTGAEQKRLFRVIRSVCRISLETVGEDFRDPPEGWLFHQRWKKGGDCPRTGLPLRYDTIAGRTTCWSPGRQQQG